jgi:hypothetical protein
MGVVIVRYTVKPDRVAENEALVRAVYVELGENHPAGFRYTTFKAADSVTFFHLASIEGESNPLAQLDSFKTFQQNLGDRCDVPPAPTNAEVVGAYGFFDQ